MNKSIAGNLQKHSKSRPSVIASQRFKLPPPPPPPPISLNPARAIIHALKVNNKWVNRFFYACLGSLAAIIALSTYVIIDTSIKGQGLVLPFGLG